METIKTVYSWLVEHYSEVLALWAGIIGVAEIIVKWTDSHKDDEVLGKVRAVGVKVISLLTKFGFEKSK